MLSKIKKRINLPKILILFFGLTSSLFLVKPIYAATFQICDPSNPSFGSLCALSANNLSGIISSVIQILLIIAIIISLIFLIIGGIRWITSGGDKAAVQAARSQIIAAIVGLIIALLAFFILTFVLGLFGVSNTTFQFPTIGGIGGSDNAGTCTFTNVLQNPISSNCNSGYIPHVDGSTCKCVLSQ